MIYTDLIVKASGPENAKLAAIGMAPQKWELGGGKPFSGPSGKIFDEALEAHKIARSSVFVTNLVNAYIDDNNLYSVPEAIMASQRNRVFAELDRVQPNVLLIMGGDTLDLLTAKTIVTKYNKKTKQPYLAGVGSRNGIVKWRGSTFELVLPSGRTQKCVAAMHPAGFLRGQWKWKPIFKHIDVKRAVANIGFPELRLTPRTAIVRPSFKHACEYLQEANLRDHVTIDYEGYEYLTCFGVGWSKSEAMCIPITDERSASYWTTHEEIRIWQLWAQLLQNPKVKKNAQNAAYEWIRSWQHGIYPNPLGRDTMHQHHCLYPDFGGITDEWSKTKRSIDNPGHGLAFITSQYTDQPFYKDDGRHWRPELGVEAFWRYNCLDVMIPEEAGDKMDAELAEQGLTQTYKEQYLDIFERSLAMEWIGNTIDVAKREAAKQERTEAMLELCKELSDAVGMQVIPKGKKGEKPRSGILNLSSPTQMQHFLYKIRGYKPKMDRKTGKITTDKEAIHALAIKHNDDVLKKMLSVKQIQDLINDVLSQKLDSQNRIHCHNKIGGTNGTRWSSTESILGSGTNLQNLPRQGVARSLFLPT